MAGKFLHWLKAKVMSLSELRDRPHAVALGIASGTFFGFIPLFGLKTLLAMAAAKLSRGNVVAAAIAVTLHDVILPLAPMILHWEYRIGYWLLSHPHHFPPALHPIGHGASMWFHWSTLFSVGLPLLIGATIIAVPFAVAAYFISLRLLEKSARRRAEAHPAD